jgi:hypothetical protein
MAKPHAKRFITPFHETRILTTLVGSLSGEQERATKQQL